MAWALSLGLVYIFVNAMFLPAFAAWMVFMNWMYWSVQESSGLQSTIGKEAFGLIVLTENDRQLSLGKASAKWLLRVVSDALLLPYLLAVIPPKKQAMHDMMTKTKVVWEGDK